MPTAASDKGQRKARVTNKIKLRRDQYRVVLMLRKGMTQDEIAREEGVWRLSIWGRIDTLAKHGVVSKGKSGQRNSNRVRVKLGTILLPGEKPMDRRWRTSTVLQLARATESTPDYGASPILADALQDAGCGADVESAKILDLLRSPIPIVESVPPHPGEEPETPSYVGSAYAEWQEYNRVRNEWAIRNRAYQDFVSGKSDPRVQWRAAIQRVVDRLLR